MLGISSHNLNATRSLLVPMNNIDSKLAESVKMQELRLASHGQDSTKNKLHRKSTSNANFKTNNATKMDDHYSTKSQKRQSVMWKSGRRSKAGSITPSHVTLGEYDTVSALDEPSMVDRSDSDDDGERDDDDDSILIDYLRGNQSRKNQVIKKNHGE